MHSLIGNIYLNYPPFSWINGSFYENTLYGRSKEFEMRRTRGVKVMDERYGVVLDASYIVQILGLIASQPHHPHQLNLHSLRDGLPIPHHGG